MPTRFKQSVNNSLRYMRVTFFSVLSSSGKSPHTCDLLNYESQMVCISVVFRTQHLSISVVFRTQHLNISVVFRTQHLNISVVFRTQHLSIAMKLKQYKLRLTLYMISWFIFFKKRKKWFIRVTLEL